MKFLIADSFTESLARLTSDEQKAAKTTAFDLQMDPSARGLSFHKLEKGKDKRFWSVRVNVDIRLIVHRTDGSLLLCYVDHHDRAYAWAERRKIEIHPKTGAAQIVELREEVREIVVPVYVQTPVPVVVAKRPLAAISDDELLGYGIPADWVKDVREADEDRLLELALNGHLPSEAAEAVLELLDGRKPSPAVPEPAAVGVAPDPFAHPDAQRHFRVVGSVEELERALEAPWEKWAVFLHPEQRRLVTRDYNGAARVAGSAGTGKTVVAVHRAVHLARSMPEGRILLATFSEPLAHALRANIRRLIGHEPRLAERLEIHSMTSLGLRLHQAQIGPVRLAPRHELDALLVEASVAAGSHGFSPLFLRTEWEQVVDAWQISTWEEYRDVQRLGRRTRLPERQRAALWAIFEQVRAGLRASGLMTESGVFQALAEAQTKRTTPAFDAAVVDEAQDVGIAQLRFLAVLGAGRPNALFFAGDLGQRIFQQPFSWKALGVDVRGRSKTLRVNYRTSHQIRRQADRLLGPEITDADGNRDDRRFTVSAFNGPPPEIQTFATEDEERAAVAAWLQRLTDEGVQPHEFGLFVRSAAQIPRAAAAVEAVGLVARVLDERVDVRPGSVNVGTMHLAKGLEFRAVAVMACDDEVLPLQARIEHVGDEGDLQEVYDTERQLLYVACTRARDRLFVSGIEPASEFLEDLDGANSARAGNGRPSDAEESARSWTYFATATQTSLPSTIHAVLNAHFLWRPARNSSGALIANVGQVKAGDWLLLAWRKTRSAYLRARVAPPQRSILPHLAIDHPDEAAARELVAAGYAPANSGALEGFRLDEVHECYFEIRGNYGGQNTIHQLAREDEAQVPHALAIPQESLTEGAPRSARRTIGRARSAGPRVSIEALRAQATKDRSFDAYVMVDWSSSSQPVAGRDSIWIATGVWTGDVFNAMEPENLPTRVKAVERIQDLIRTWRNEGRRRVLAGLDFAFGYPAGFARALGLTERNGAWRAIHEHFATNVTDSPSNASNRDVFAAACNRTIGAPGPFWGCARSAATDVLTQHRVGVFTFPHHGLAEWRETDLIARQRVVTQSVWKLNCGVSVGGQTILGIKHLQDLATAVKGHRWPFEGWGTPEGEGVWFAEIFPALASYPEWAEAYTSDRDRTQVLSCLRRAAERDGEGLLKLDFARPTGLDTAALARAEDEEGWMLWV